MADAQTQALTPLPVHVPTSAESSAYLVEKLTNEGTVMVVDPVTRQKRQLRLAVVMVAGTPALIAVGDT